MILSQSFMQSGSPTTLSGKAAEVRGVVPWVEEAFLHVCPDEGGKAVKLAKEGLHHLNVLYNSLSHTITEQVKASCNRLCILMLALHYGWPHMFSFKPKMHLMIELIEHADLGAKPSNSWTYRGEEFGGSLKHLATSSGGPMTPPTIARRVLLRFAALEPL